ncbi:MAG: hypothetical protein K2K01_00495, partial [Eubacterium sp.]|nr:hypothetical protein [Eubacterium sp.]
MAKNKGEYRELSKNFTEAWQKSELKDFYEEHKEELYIGIRGGYINLYYKGASISKIEYKSKLKKFDCTIAKRYLYGKDSERGRQRIAIKDLREKYDDIKKNVDIIQTDEKVAQQLIVQSINANNSEWQCVDMEYAKNEQAGRFDIIAVTKKKPYKVALIELKYDSKAIGGTNGICKHAEDFLEFVDKNKFEHLKHEIPHMISSYRKLVSASQPEVLEEEFCDAKPYICFMILANNNNNLLKQTKRYLFADAYKASA